MAQVINPRLGMYHKMPKVPLASLPSAALFQAITRYEILDYGGNIATAVGGAWRFEFPFRTTWTNRPPVNLVPVGAELQVTNYNNQKWISDGTYWRPAQGVVVLYDLFGLNDGTGHIAQIAGATSGTFAIPGGLKIPESMILNGTKISVQVEAAKVGANGTANFSVTLGILNSASGGVMSSISVPSATGSQMFASCAARFGVSTTKFNTRNSLGEGVTQASPSTIMYDRTNNINTAADMWINVNINSANAGDAFNLIGIQVKLEA